MEASQRRGVAGAALCVILLVAGIAAGPAQAGPKGASAPKAGKAIVGGGIADIASWPFEAAILRKGRLDCGGSVIAPTKILTAAHCVLGFGVSQFSVVIGRATLSSSGTGQVIPVASGVAHPDYANTRRHDVAVLTLDFATTAPRIALPSAEQAAAATVPGSLLRSRAGVLATPSASRSQTRCGRRPRGCEPTSAAGRHTARSSRARR